MSPDPGRREILRRLGQAGLVLGGAGLAAGLGLVSPGRWSQRRRPATLPDFALAGDPGRPGGVVARGGGPPARLVRAALESLGGMGRFVRQGETVMLKPNSAWDRTPEQGANTHPEVVAEVARLCREAGAARVIVAEVPVQDAERTLTRSGIRKAAMEAGAEVVVPPAAGFQLASLAGSVLDRWEVLETVFQVDRVINLPVVKDHGLSLLTCGLKNWYGLLGGTRGRLHQRIHAAIADLGAAFRPTLTVVDAVRVMLRGGPTGGRLEDVVRLDAVAVGTDPVALDAWGATLLELDPRDVGYIPLAEGKGLGVADPGSLEEIRVGA